MSKPKLTCPGVIAEQLSAECVSIPIYPELTREQLDAVAAAAVEFFAPIETAATL